MLQGYVGFRASKKLGTPFFVSLHDENSVILGVYVDGNYHVGFGFRLPRKDLNLILCWDLLRNAQGILS